MSCLESRLKVVGDGGAEGAAVGRGQPTGRWQLAVGLGAYQKAI